MNSKHLLSTLCLIVASIIWGTAFVAQTTGMEFIGPLTFTNMRFLIGGIIVLPFAFYEINKIKNLKNKKKFIFFKKYIKNFEDLKIQNNLKTAIIIPDKDIIPGAETLTPAYIVFENYEKILNWNRSLRFALAVCTLKESFKNEI